MAEILKTGANITKQANTIVINANSGDIDLSSAKSIIQSSDSTITHGSYRHPEGPETQDLLVTEVRGPEKVFVGLEYTYTATGFSRRPVGGELLRVKWAYKIDDGAIQEFPNGGEVSGSIVRKRISIHNSLVDNQKLTVYAYLQGPSDDASVESEIQVIIVTTRAGKYLFSLKASEAYPAKKMTAQEVYDAGMQWFCPHADNYVEMLHIDPDIATFSELKHFTWQAIVTFAEVDRFNFQYRSGGAGDWKSVATGGDGYLLVSVGGYPYWADAIGQIPFTVDIYRENLEDGKTPEQATRATLATGQQYGDGSIFGGASDFSNSYDNHIILRTCLWGANRYRAITTPGMIWDSINVQTTSYSPNNLSRRLTRAQVDTYF